MSAFARLEKVTKKWPYIPKLVDIFVQARLEGEFEWPRWCFLPLNAWLPPIFVQGSQVDEG